MSSFMLSFRDFKIDFNLDFDVDIATMDPYSAFAMYAEKLMQGIEPKPQGSSPQPD